MRIDLEAWLLLRATMIAFLKAVDTMLLKQYGWTPRCRQPILDE